MRLIKSVGCNNRTNLQQICNEIRINNAKSCASVHNRRWIQTQMMPDYS